MLTGEALPVSSSSPATLAFAPEPSNVASLQKIAQTAGAIPSVPVWFQQNAVLSRFICNAVICGKKVDKPQTLVAFQAYAQPDLARLCAQIMHNHYGVVTPIVAHGKDLPSSAAKYIEIAPPDLRNFLTHANDALHPVQQRIRIAALLGDVYVFVAIRATAYHGQNGLVTG